LFEISDEERKNLSEYNFDHPNAFDFDLLYKHLCQLIKREEIQMPIYDFTTSSRQEKTQLVTPANVIIFEGILAFYDRVFDY
jgi:uridine kinase